MVKVMGLKGLVERRDRPGTTYAGSKFHSLGSSWQKHVYQTLPHTDRLDRGPGRCADLEEHL